MIRLHLTFACGSLSLAGTIDSAPATTGLLIVSGGNEIRSGAFSGQSLMAARIAKAGFPVFRFDRRGIGDSEGENRGFRNSAGDIAAAVKAFRGLAPQLDRVIGFGNCDAASALMLSGGEGFHGLVLSNPWTIEESDGDADEPALPAAAIRSRYLEKLTNPAEIGRLLRGGVDMRKLGRGIAGAFRSPPEPSSLAEEMREGLARFSGPAQILLASADRTAQMFEAAWDKDDVRIARCKGAGHAYVEPAHSDWLDAQILSALRA
ncbi:MAG: hydrolase 1, exosortase A system-associated [Pseudomonadota bacterium]